MSPDDSGELHPTAERFRAGMRTRGLELAVRTAPASARTAAEAAAALGVEVGQIVKSLVFLRDGASVMVLCAGDRRVAADRLALRPANAELARTATGYAIGGIPPFGHPQTLPTLIDGSLWRFDTVWAAAGTPHAVFPITPDALRDAIAGAEVADVGEPPLTPG